jgi:Ethanolamine utilization protein EutJ (predicted chaperonin)
MATPNIVPRADSEGGIGTSSKYWASAYIDLIYVGAGKVGRDADNLIDFSTDNQIDFRVAAGHRLRLTQTSLAPITTDSVSLGTSSLNFSDLFLDSGAVINFDGGDIALTHSSNTLEFSGGLMRFVDNSKANFGTGNDLEIYHDATNSKIDNRTGNLTINNGSDDGDIIFSSDDGSGGETTYLTIDGGDERVNFSKNAGFGDDVKAMFGAGLDLRIFHEAGGTSKIENYVGNLTIQQRADDADIVFQCDDGSGGLTEYLRLDGGNTRIDISKFMRFADGVEARFGAQSDLQVHHDGSNSYISQNGTGDLYIKQMTTDEDLVFQCDDGAGGDATYFYLDGSSATHDGSATTALYTNWPDYSRISLGTGHDMLMYHDGTQTVYQNRVGNFYITQAADDLDIIFQCDDGSGGTTEYLRFDGSSVQTIVTKNFRYLDNAQAMFGTSEDLAIYHDATDSYVNNATGDLYIKNTADDKDIIFQSDNGSGGVETYFFLDGSESVVTFLDDKRLTFGTDRDLFLYHTGSEAQMKNYTGQLTFTQEVNDGDIVFKSDDGSGGTTAYITLDGSLTRTIANQHLQMADGKALYVGAGSDAGFYHLSGHNYIENNTGDLYITNSADDKDIIFQSDDGSGGTETYFFLDGSLSSGNPFTVFPDDSILTFGNSQDLQIKHSSSYSYIDNTAGGDLIIRQFVDDKDIIFQNDDGSGGLTTYFFLDGSGTNTNFQKNTLHKDSAVAYFGGASDMGIYHNGTNSYIENATGNLEIINHLDDGDIIFKSDDGSGGVETYMFLDGSEKQIHFYQNTKHNDNVKARFGAGNDLEIYHDATDSIITNGTGNLNFYQNTDDGDIRFYNDNGSGGTTEYFRLDGGDSSTQIKTIKVLMPNLPTSDPSVAGQLWNDSGTLKISAG